ncbi:MAG TPA: Calx-beta domain-containing protein [Methylomirabilota bacterium]|nr:Calx-beta domain-containing protein [Methylomirabilota bacterium]
MALFRSAFILVTLLIWVSAFSARAQEFPSATLRELRFTAQDVAYEPLTRQLLIAAPVTNGLSRIHAINPATELPGPILLEGSGSAVIEPDGLGGIYVAFNGSHTIHHYNLQTRQITKSFSVSTNMPVVGMKVVSHDRGQIAVTSQAQIEAFYFETVLYQNGVLLTNSAPWANVQGVEPGGSYVFSLVRGYQKYRVTPSGLELVVDFPSEIQGFLPQFVVSGSEIYVGNGEALTLDLGPRPPFPAPSPVHLVFNGVAYADDRQTNDVRAAFYWHTPFRRSFQIFDADTRTPIVDVDTPNATAVAEIFPWGAEGYGVRLLSDDRLYALDLQPVPHSDVTLSVSAPPSAPNGGLVAFDLVVANTGEAAENVVLQNTLSEGLLYRSSVMSTGAVSAFAREVTWSLGTLQPGQTATLRIEATAAGLGSSLNIATISHTGVETRPADNRVVTQITTEPPSSPIAATYYLPLNHIAADPETGLLYMSVAYSSGLYPYGVVQYQPSSNVVNTLGSYPVAPDRLELSDDGRFLWISLQARGEIERLDLLGQSPNVRFKTGLPAPATDIAALPGSTASLLVSSTIRSVVFDGTSPRPTTGPGGFVEALDSSVAVQYDPQTYKLRELTLPSDGIYARELSHQLIEGEPPLLAAAGKIFLPSGVVLNAADGPRLAQLPIGQAAVLHADEAANELYALSHDSVKWRLSKFRLSTLQQLADIEVPAPVEFPKNLTKWAPGGYAYNTANFLYVIQEPPAPNADIAITSAVFHGQPQTAAAPFTWKLTITNEGPEAATNVTLIANLDGPGKVTRASGSTTTSFPNPFTRTFPLLRAGQSETVELTITPQSGGLFDLNARVDRFGPDADFSNNRVHEFHSHLPGLGVVGGYQIPVSAIDFDRTTGELFLATPVTPDRGVYDGALLALNPDTLALRKILSFGESPTMLAMTESADIGYVALDGDYSAASFEVTPPRLSAKFAIPTRDTFSLNPRPGTTNVLAVSESEGVMIFTNGVGARLTNVVGTIAFDYDNPDRLYHLQEGGKLTRFRLGATNVAEASSTLPFGNIVLMESLLGRLIFANGQVVDAQTMSIAGLLPGFSENQTATFMTVDRGRDLLYLFLRGSNTDELAIYDGRTLAKQGRIVIPSLGWPVELRAFGHYAAIVDHPGRIFEAMRLAFFRIPGPGEVNLATSIKPVNASAGITIPLTFVATNQGPWTATNSVLEVQLPGGFNLQQVVTTNQHEVLGARRDRVRVTIPTLLGSSGVEVQLLGQFAGAIPAAHVTASISSSGRDTFDGDNTATLPIQVLDKPVLIAWWGQTNATASGLPDVVVVEGSTIPNVLRARFTLSHPVSATTSFQLTLTNGSVRPEDVLQPSTNLVQTVTFAANRTNVDARSFLTIPNTVSNELRTLTFVLSNPVGIMLPVTNVPVLILDDDSLPIITFPPVGLQYAERRTNYSVTLIARLSRPPQAAGSVDYRFVSETAREGEDFLGGTGTVAIASGSFLNVPIPIEILADAEREGRETFRLELFNPRNVQLAETVFQIGIADPGLSPAEIVRTFIHEDRLSVRFTTRQMHSYRLLRSPTLQSPVWQPVGDQTLHTNGSGFAELTDPEPMNQRMMFYRIEERSLL